MPRQHPRPGRLQPRKPGHLGQLRDLFLAGGLSPARSAQEHAEVIEIHWVSFAQACRWAIDGTIADCKTALGLLRAREILTNGTVGEGIP